jgi:hypothetical protein
MLALSFRSIVKHSSLSRIVDSADDIEGTSAADRGWMTRCEFLILLYHLQSRWTH